MMVERITSSSSRRHYLRLAVSTSIGDLGSWKVIGMPRHALPGKVSSDMSSRHIWNTDQRVPHEGLNHSLHIGYHLVISGRLRPAAVAPDAKDGRSPRDLPIPASGVAESLPGSHNQDRRAQVA